MWNRLLAFLFPPKCVLCRRLLSDKETDLCHSCREHAPQFLKENFKLSFVARWTAVWYYKDDVRSSLLRYKFGNRRSYAKIYSRLLAMKVLQQFPEGVDVLTWVPISRLRRMFRGFDQVELIANAVGQELGLTPVKLLKKIRHTRPQSSLGDISRRKANVMNAYRVLSPEQVCGKRILLLDDIITTGATAAECAKMLCTAGAKSVYFAAVAAASHDKKQVTK